MWSADILSQISNEYAHSGEYSLEVTDQSISTLTFALNDCKDEDSECFEVDSIESVYNTYYNSGTGVLDIEGFTGALLGSATVEQMEFVSAVLSGMIDFSSPDEMDFKPFCYPPCRCESQPDLIGEQEYLLSFWVRADAYSPSYEDVGIRISTNLGLVLAFNPVFTENPTVDEWQLVSKVFVLPASFNQVNIEFINDYEAQSIFIDDIKVQPFHANGKCYVYDPFSLRLVAEFDENHFATFYNYDLEGKLTRIKKETAEGVFTVQETNYHQVRTP